jgi:hypothetical protein
MFEVREIRRHIDGVFVAGETGHELAKPPTCLKAMKRVGINRGYGTRAVERCPYLSWTSTATRPNTRGPRRASLGGARFGPRPLKL